MGRLNPSEGMNNFMKNLLGQPPKGDISDVEDVLRNRTLGRKTMMYKNLGQEVRLKERRQDGKEILLTDDSVWTAKEKCGKNQEHAKRWDNKDLVKVTMWNEAGDDYTIVNLAKRDESIWTFKCLEKETPQ